MAVGEVSINAVRDNLVVNVVDGAEVLSSKGGRLLSVYFKMAMIHKLEERLDAAVRITRQMVG